MPFSTIFFDLDDTLYPASSGLWQIIKERMNLYMHQTLGIDLDTIPTLRERYFREYGTTLRGLQAHYPVNIDEYLSFVHDIPIQNYLHPDENLQHMLQALTFRKLIFTNADAAHARRVLAALGLENCFDAIVDIKIVNPYCKPMQQAFKIALEIAGEPDPRRCILLDDLPGTTRAARALGLYAILFGQNGFHPDANATLDRLTDLPELLQGLKY
jgi:putative hydrolase of the HAD superfamily